MPNNNPSDCVYILITQCLQNAFFLEEENRMCLPPDTAMRMLVGSQRAPHEAYRIGGDRVQNLQKRIQRVRVIRKLRGHRTDSKQDYSVNSNRRVLHWAVYPTLPPARPLYYRGPLYRFLQAAIDDTTRAHDLHVINIRDWHKTSPEYDDERRRYGSHCESGSWGAEPLDGFGRYLRPWKQADIMRSRMFKDKGNPLPKDKAVSSQDALEDIIDYYSAERKTHFYDVRSDSVFDFKPSTSYTNEAGKISDSESANPDQKSHLELILDSLISSEKNPSQVYIVVIGVYTDIKIKTLLMGLRTRYNVRNLIVSDVLTAAPNLERHLSGLDFADKVLNIEIIHSLNDLVHILNPSKRTNTIPQRLTRYSINFRDYRSYFLDKQNLLSYQDQKQIEYLELTEERARRLYHQVHFTNRTLIGFGFVFLTVTLVASILQIFGALTVPPETLIITGALSLLQLVAVFFRGPLNRLQDNLNNLVQQRANLENHSLVLALMRHHFASPELMYPQDGQKQIDQVREQIKMIQAAATTSAAIFAGVGQKKGGASAASNLNGAAEETPVETSVG